MPHKTMPYPEINPFESGHLAVDDLHQIYWEQCGNPEGIPVLFVHGGPGGGTSPSCRRFFDPEIYRIILVDQRGSGKSSPLGELENNTTQHLIADFEVIRKMLGIEKWLLFGGSWGSTLSMLYAQAHPKRCLGLVLRGIFLCRPEEFVYFYQGGRIMKPAEWAALTARLSEEEKLDVLHAYHKRLLDPDESVRRAAAHDWSVYEGACATLKPNPEVITEFSGDDFSYAIARIETHYFVNNCFQEENQILRNIDQIRHLPCVIIQGAYDIVCPPISAYDLSQAWPEADYHVIPDGGHSTTDPGIQAALVKAMEHMKSIVAQ